MTKYDKTYAGRLRTAKQYHKNIVAKQPITKLDDFSAKQLEAIWNNQKGICPCCGLAIDGFEKADMSHISKSFFFKASNFQLLHHGCNKAQGDLTIPFVSVIECYGECFLDLFNNDRDWTIATFNLQENDVQRFDRRIESIKKGKV